MCEVTCATAAEVKQVLGKVVIQADATMLLVEPGLDKETGLPRVQSIGAGLDQDLGEVERAPEMSHQEWVAANEKLARERIARIARALHVAVAADNGAIAARADAVRATLTDAERTALDKLVTGVAMPEPDQILRAAAVVCMAAEAPRRAGDRERLRGAVADAAKTVLVRQPVSGAKWAHFTGCGTTIEGEKESAMIACGMGHVPPLGERFLFFYTKQ
jgi:hypothetical protein